MTQECSVCGSALGSDTAFCPVCAVGAAPSAPFPIEGSTQVAPQVTVPNPRRNTHPVGGAIFGAVVVALSAVLIFRPNGVSAETFGYWLGGLLIPGLIAYAISGARKRRNWLAYSGWLLLFVLVLNRPGHTLNSMSKPQMMRQLSGVDPIDTGLVGEQREAVRVTRAVFDDIKQFRNSQSTARAEVEAIYSELNTPNSFADRSSIRRILEALTKTDQLNSAMSIELNAIPDKMRAEVGKSDLSTTTRTAIANQLIEGYQNSKSRQASIKMLSAASAWVGAETNLYQYVEVNSDQVSVKNGKVRIVNNDVLDGFNTRINSVNDRRGAYLAAAQSYQEAVGNERKALGISGADLGFD